MPLLLCWWSGSNVNLLIARDKEIINNENNGSGILLRGKDENGLVVGGLNISPGTGAKLDSLKKGGKYFFEIKTTQRKTLINATDV